MIRRTWIARLFAAAIAVVAVSSDAARAGIIPVSVTVTPQSGNFRWTYGVVLPSDMQLQAGNYFTIYDFGGFVPDSIQAPEGWTASVTPNATPPVGLEPVNNPTITDITFTYNGDTIPTGQIGLGNFWAVSTVGDSVSTQFTAQNIQVSTGNIDRNIVDTIAPGPSVTPEPTPGVPEPTTLALAALGLPMVGAVRMIRRKK